MATHIWWRQQGDGGCGGTASAQPLLSLGLGNKALEDGATEALHLRLTLGPGVVEAWYASHGNGVDPLGHEGSGKRDPGGMAEDRQAINRSHTPQALHGRHRVSSCTARTASGI